MSSIDLLITNANEVLTLHGPNKPRVKQQLGDLRILHQADVAINNGIIIDVGTHLEYDAESTINATGKTVMPGFIDPHTHLVYSGSREFELDMKLKGSSYMDILKQGGGIFYTVEKTRKATSTQLIKESTKRLDNMMLYGTTSCEAKSGYGLDRENEMKILDVQQKLAQQHPMDIYHTFLGAHAIPKEMSAKEYTSHVINDMIPECEKKAMFCDVFCEEGVFTPGQSKEILEAGKKHGMIPKIHADEIIDTGGASLASSVGAISADHLLRSNTKGLQEMAKNGVVGVLLPGTPFCLMMEEFAPARTMIDLGVPLALATDLNPNCYTENMQFMIQLACLKMKMTPSEAIIASTFNAACALGIQKKVGSIETGKQADIILLDCPNHQHLPYHFGINLVETVIKKGMLIS